MTTTQIILDVRDARHPFKTIRTEDIGGLEFEYVNGEPLSAGDLEALDTLTTSAAALWDIEGSNDEYQRGQVVLILEFCSIDGNCIESVIGLIKLKLSALNRVTLTKPSN